MFRMGRVLGRNDGPNKKNKWNIQNINNNNKTSY